MRKPTFVLALTFTVGAAAAAQERAPRQVHLGVDPGIVYSDSTGLEFDNVYSLGVTVPLRGRWSLDSTLSWWGYSEVFPSCPPDSLCLADPEALIAPGNIESDVYGLDLFTLHGIPTDTRWYPYVGFGLRTEHVDYDNRFSAVRDTWWGLSPGVALGFALPFGERFSLQLDGRFYPSYTDTGASEGEALSDFEDRRSDTLVRLGLGWRF
ncbi:MAG: outer membrane protein [Thermoanaerobaculia bacterium]